MEWLRCRISDERGEDVVEYALVLVLVSLAALALIMAAGVGVGTLWAGACWSISQAASIVGGAIPCN